MPPQGISGHSKPTHSSQPVGQHKETADILRLAELLRVAVLRGQASCWVPATTRAARALLGSTLLQVFSISPGAGTDHSQQTLRGTQQAGEMGKQESQRSAKKSAKSCTGEQPCPAAQTGEWAAADSLAENSSEPWATTGPCSTETPQRPGLHGRSTASRVREGTLHSAQSSWDTAQALGPALGSPAQHRMGTREWIQLRATKVVKWLEYLTDKENLGELGLSLSPGEERAQVISPACANAWEGGVKEEPNSSQ